MADTIGSLVDKLATVNNKMFFNQEFLYEIRRMSKEEFTSKYITNQPELEDLYGKLLKIVDLNLQRQSLIVEHDKLLVQMIMDIADGNIDSSRYVFDQHKTLDTK
jgi:hypothetical protein